MTRFIVIDGKPEAAVPALDRGLQFGDGLFETMAVVNGRVRLLEKHLARLSADCGRLTIELPSVEWLSAELGAAARRLSRGIIKLIVTRGSGDRGYRLPANPVSRWILVASDWPELPKSLRMMVCKTRLAAGGSLAGIKHLNRLEQVLACAEWQQIEQIDEGLMLDPENRVVEATSANVFIVREGRVQTPDLKRCGVAGIMRELVIELIQESGGRCETTDIVLADVLAADEVFLTNSITGIRPVIALENQTWKTGPLTRSLLQLLDRRLDRDTH